MPRFQYTNSQTHSTKKLIHACPLIIHLKNANQVFDAVKDANSSSFNRYIDSESDNEVYKNLASE